MNRVRVKEILVSEREFSSADYRNDWYRQFVYDDNIHIIETSTNYSAANKQISTLALYNVRRSTTNYPGQLITSLTIKRRWPSWEAAQSQDSSDIYQIYYTQQNSLNQTYLMRAEINLNTNDVQIVQSEDFGRSCLPGVPVYLEVTKRFVMMRCDDLIVYQRYDMKIIAIIKQPVVDGRTITIEKDEQILIFGTKLNKTYMSEIMISGDGLSLRQSDVNFEVGFEYRTVLQARTNITAQRMDGDTLTIRSVNASGIQQDLIYYSFKVCSYLEYRNGPVSCSPCG